MNINKKSIPAFIVGLVGGLIGIIGAILILVSGIGGLKLGVSIFLLLLPSVLIIVGSGICLRNSSVGGIIMAICAGLYLIGMCIACFGLYLVAIIAFPIIAAALVLAFSVTSLKSKQINEEDIIEIEEADEFDDVNLDEKVEVKSMFVKKNLPTTNTLSIIGLIFAFLMPILGLLFGITGMRDAKKYHGGRGEGMGLSAIIISSVELFILLIVLFVAFI